MGSIDARGFSLIASLIFKQKGLILISFDPACPIAVKWSISSWESPILRSFNAQTNYAGVNFPWPLVSIEISFLSIWICLLCNSLPTRFKIADSLD